MVICYQCGHPAELVETEFADDSYGLCSIRGPYLAHTSCHTEEATECCESTEWTEIEEEDE
jgi:hypothetical protein